MTRIPVFIGAALLGLLSGLATWLPASVVLSALPAPYACAEARGTLWHGRCETLRHGSASLGAVTWRLRPLPLSVGRIDVVIGWSTDGGDLSMELASRSGMLPGMGPSTMVIRDLRGSIAIDTLRALPLWPPSVISNWPPCEGRLRLAVQTVEFSERGLSRIVGTIDADGLVSVGRERWTLGDYRLAWPQGGAPDGGPVAQLTDRGGPLELRARLRPLRSTAESPAGGAWSLTGSVKARDEAWRRRLSVFGPADAAGRHPLSVEYR